MAYHGLSLPSSSSEQKFMVQFVVPPGIWQLGVDRQPQRSGCIKERLMIKTMKSRGKNKRMAKHSAASKYRINKRLWKIAMLLPCSGSNDRDRSEFQPQENVGDANHASAELVPHELLEK